MNSSWQAWLKFQASTFEALPDNSSGEQFAKFAVHHGVAARFATGELDFYRKRNQAKALNNLRHIHLLTQLLSAAGIPHLFFKGAPLALRLYGDVGKRHAGDIDLWIDVTDLDRTHRLLLASGHVPSTGYDQLSPYLQDKYRNHKFHLSYDHKPGQASVEIHWRLGSTWELFPLSISEALGRSILLDSSPHSIPILGDSDHLLFLYSHAAKHLWERLFWLIDIADFHQLPSAPSPRAILDQARSWGLDRAVLATWAQTGEVLPVPGILPLSDDPVVRFLGKLSHLGLPPQSPNWKAPLQFCFGVSLLHRSPRHKMSILAEYATAADDWYRMQVPDGHAWTYALLRPMTRLLRCLGKH